jgi:hypothetical protein
MKKSEYRNFMLGDKMSSRLTLVAGLVTIFQFVIFKVLYPFPDFTLESYDYISEAFRNAGINFLPIGYSKFLLAFHYFTHSDLALIAFQYFFLEVAFLYFLLNLLYFYHPGKAARKILFVFLFFNPISLYISNRVDSSSLFVALSILWIGEILLIVNRPAWYRILTQGILLFCCISVQNIAFIYLIIALITFATSKQPAILKLVGSGLSLTIACIIFVRSRDEAEKYTGVRRFSMHAGWQLANDALYMRGHVSMGGPVLAPEDSRELDILSIKFFSRAPAGFDESLSEYGPTFFIDQPSAPLQQYYSRHYHPKDDFGEVVAKWQAAETFSEYGEWMICKYPGAFFRYFVLMSCGHYFLPLIGDLDSYNQGQEEIGWQAQDWFDYRSPNVAAISNTLQSWVLSPIPYIFFFLQVLALGCVGWLVISRRVRALTTSFAVIIVICALLLFGNFGYSVLAGAVSVENQFFPMILVLTFCLLLIGFQTKSEVDVGHAAGINSRHQLISIL